MKNILLGIIRTIFLLNNERKEKKKKIMSLISSDHFTQDLSNYNLRDFYLSLYKINKTSYLTAERIILSDNSNSNIRNWDGNYEITLVRELNFSDDYESYEFYDNNMKLVNKLSDTRIFQYKNNNYLMGTEWNNGVWLLSLYKLENDNYKRYFVLNNITKCSCEKNWSIIIKDNNLYFHYGLHDYIIIKFNLDLLKKQLDEYDIKDFNLNKIQIENLDKENKLYQFIYPSNSQYFCDVRKKYLNGLYFSNTTRFIKFTENELISIGHIKISYEHETIQKNNNIIKFLSNIRKKYNLTHNIYKWYEEYPKLIHINKIIYLLFFYTIDSDTFCLKRFSDFIIPKTNLPTTVVFPCDITEINNDNFLIFYNINDTQVEHLKKSKKELDELLQYSIVNDFEDVDYILNWS